MNRILPGATIGILGGGQLGRMTAMAARSLGYRVQVLDPDPACPASFVVDACFQAGWDDAWEAGNLARGCDVVTLEIEQISLQSMEAARRHAPVRPGAEILAIVQDRIEQKNWLVKHGFPVGAYRAARSVDELIAGVKELAGPCFVKSSQGGYDGKGQAKIGFSGEATEAEIREAWIAVGEDACVAERAVSLEQEISVMVARSPDGEMKIFPAASNFHENQILAWSVIPATIPIPTALQSRKIAEELADTLQLEGILAVEMFVTKDGTLLVNELAPRAHNSYHASERACMTGQFEQAVRAICNLPLGGVDVVQPAAIANLLGDVWLKGPPKFDAALAVPGVRLHLYEKERPRAGRKMGHLSGVGATPAEAVERVLEAARRL
ncbi:MAG: 5-(carboxyamino)imidazole ribonucleotide synthase [Acidobacteriaceae bacterium]|jgi:5-(carboxyamino)imidazole ribonucleotide synthase|nr:5-(carboxyamino)imidazole ribonucleotide synthase [Acidobacteriaceae bacterium]